MGDALEKDQPLEQGNPDRLNLMLDEIERRVEAFRLQATYLETEKQCLLESLHNLQLSPEFQQINKQCEREELQVNAERLICRCLTVEVSVATPRSDSQEEALKSVNDHIEKMDKNTDSRTQHLQALLSACTSDNTMDSVPADQKFQTLLLGCTLDDQKNIHKRIKQLLEAS